MARAEVSRSGRRVTSADVAREAGVSRTTVSFVLNNTPRRVIPEETRKRVLDAVARLSYRPSAEARALRRGRTDVVLLYLPPGLPMTNGIGALIEQLSTAFAAARLTMVAHSWTSHPAAEVWAATTPAGVLAWQVDDDVVESIRRDGVRAVTSLTGGSDPIGRWVQGPREDEIARLQVGRLAEAGHVQLGYAMPDDKRMAGAGQLRLAALRRACTERDLPEPTALRVPLDPGRAAETITTWRTSDPPVTAICAHDTTAALAVLTGLRVLGMAAPGDLAVVGVNDTPAAALADPPLTMVALDAAASAAYIVEVVAALLDERAAPEPGPRVAALVERGSV